MCGAHGQTTCALHRSFYLFLPHFFSLCANTSLLSFFFSLFLFLSSFPWSFFLFFFTLGSLLNFFFFLLFFCYLFSFFISSSLWLLLILLLSFFCLHTGWAPHKRKSPLQQRNITTVKYYSGKIKQNSINLQLLVVS